MRKLTGLFAVVCMLTSIGVLTAQQGSQISSVHSVEQQRITKTYSVKDLAVWSANGAKFDASILVALLKSKVTPGQWDNKNSIVPHAGNASLVVSTTQDAHQSIADELAGIRKL